MLDINLIRTKPTKSNKTFSNALLTANLIKKIIALDDKRKEILGQLKICARKNKVSKTKPTPEIIAQMKANGEEAKIRRRVASYRRRIKTLMSDLPNITADDVVAGGKENNKVIKTFGKNLLKFTPKTMLNSRHRLTLLTMSGALKCPAMDFGYIAEMARFWNGHC